MEGLGSNTAIYGRARELQVVNRLHHHGELVFLFCFFLLNALWLKDMQKNK